MSEYPAVEAERYNVFFRVRLEAGEGDNTVIVRLKNIDPYILKKLRYKFITIPPDNQYIDTKH